jgi:serpin B
MNFKFCTAILASLFVFQATFAGDDDTKSTQINAFGFELLKAANPNENFVFTPLGLMKTTHMLYLGSAGATKSNFEAKFSMKEKGLAEQLGSQTYSLNKIEKMNITLYNALWLQKDYVVNKKLAKNLSKYYAFEMRTKDFKIDGAESVGKVNFYIEEATRGFIKTPLVDGDIDNNTELMALTGVNYRYSLLEPFKYNEKASFAGKETDYVGLTNDKLYYDNDSYQAVAMDMEKNKQTMIFIQPKEGKTVSDIVNSLGNEEYTNIWDGFRTRTVKMSIPKFQIAQSFNLKSVYEKAGFGDLFTSTSALAGISENKVKLDGFKHEVKYSFTGEIKGNGKKLGVQEISPKTRVFELTRPFVFIIQDNTTKSIVLMGVINKI